MYIEGIGEVQVVNKNTVRPRTNTRTAIVNEKQIITKKRERLDLIIRAEIGISYREMLGEIVWVVGREIRDLVDLSLGELGMLEGWLNDHKMELRGRYPSMVVKVARTKEDEKLHDNAERINGR